MITAVPLQRVAEPGDKGRGLQELQRAGLPIPQTLVVANRGSDGSGDLITGADAIFDYLKLTDAGSVMVRPSLTIARDDAAGVSGLYPSRPTDLLGLAAVVASTESQYRGSDRGAELRFLGDEHASQEMRLLLQPYVVPEWSGVAHAVFGEAANFRVSCGIVAGHLESLVSGQADGWNCDLTAVRLEADEDVALVADEEPLAEILGLPAAQGCLEELFRGMSALGQLCAGDREVEWAVARGRVVFFQSQPLTFQGGAGDDCIE
jgi:hypothetical protein